MCVCACACGDRVTRLISFSSSCTIHWSRFLVVCADDLRPASVIYLRDRDGDGQRKEDLLAALEEQQGQRSLLQHLLLSGLSLLRDECGHQDGNQDEDRKHLNESHGDLLFVVDLGSSELVDSILDILLDLLLLNWKWISRKELFK